MWVCGAFSHFAQGATFLFFYYDYEMYGLWNLDTKLASHCPFSSHSCSMNSRLCREQDKWIKRDTTLLGRLKLKIME